MSYQPFDEMESYFDLDPGFSSASPFTGFATTGTIDPHDIMRQSEQSSQAFSGPSFEYNRYKQLTGLPTGAVSNVTEFNEITDFSFNNSLTGSSFNDMGYNTGLDFDFNTALPNQDSTSAFFFPNDTTSMAALDTMSDSMNFQPTPVPITGARLYPGMHSQQAQQAKAEALARQQRDQQMGQQIMQQRQQQQQQQQQQTVASSSASSSSRQGQKSSVSPSQDPVVEERISRLLDQMRHNSTVSSIEEEGGSPGSSGDAGRIARMKKDEEDMDEDERLLASDEGKKLSSKERRQLRNKVSARAFRSRRKEYITQLEGEVAVKSTECNELKARNRNLSEQNQQLTRLTQTLLRHPAFSTFLSEMSNDPSLLEPDQNTAAPSTEEYEPVPKQEQSHDTQINMAIMPQTRLDLSMLNLGGSHWNSSFNFQQPQVFSVLDLPQGPLVDGLSNLSGKPACDSEPEAVLTNISKSFEPKPILPLFSAMEQPAVEITPFDATGIDEDDERFALYLNSTCVSTTPVSDDSAPNSSLFLNQSFNHKSTSFKLVVSNPLNEAAAMEEINNLFNNLAYHSRRVEELTSHLPQ